MINLTTLKNAEKVLPQKIDKKGMYWGYTGEDIGYNKAVTALSRVGVEIDREAIKSIVKKCLNLEDFPEDRAALEDICDEIIQSLDQWLLLKTVEEKE